MNYKDTFNAQLQSIQPKKFGEFWENFSPNWPNANFGLGQIRAGQIRTDNSQNHIQNAQFP